MKAILCFTAITALALGQPALPDADVLEKQAAELAAQAKTLTMEFDYSKAEKLAELGSRFAEFGKFADFQRFDKFDNGELAKLKAETDKLRVEAERFKFKPGEFDLLGKPGKDMLFALQRGHGGS